jgi:hypothetical protein
MPAVTERMEVYPGYDVLKKRNSPSWNAQTRSVIDRRLAIEPDMHRFFTDAEWATVKALADRIVPQPEDRETPVPVAAMVDGKLCRNAGDGYRVATLPPLREAWRRGLAALDHESRKLHGKPFHEAAPEQQDGLVKAMQEGRLTGPAWGGMPCRTFFTQRIVSDLVKSYYTHPTAWSEVGFGGPASPRGYVRMDFNRRDPWEAAEAAPGAEAAAIRENRHVGR